MRIALNLLVSIILFICMVTNSLNSEYLKKEIHNTNLILMIIPCISLHSVFYSNRKCNKCESLSKGVLSPLVLNISFAKFLELLFYDNTTISLCGHSLFNDKVFISLLLFILKTIKIDYGKYIITITIRNTTVYDIQSYYVVSLSDS